MNNPAPQLHARCWTPQEQEILEREYPRGGSAAVIAAFKAAGFERSREAITSRATKQGIAGPARARPSVTGELHTAPLELVRDSRGLPLTAADVAEELEINYRKARQQLEELTAVGLLAEREADRGQRVWYDPRAT